MKLELTIRLKGGALKISAASVSELGQSLSKLGPLKKKILKEFPVKKRKPVRLPPHVEEIRKMAEQSGYCEKHELYFEKKLGCSKCEFEKRSGKKAAKQVIGIGGVPASW